MLNARSQSILEAAIKEHIKTGEPVSSKEIAKKYDFGVKDATIRNELNQLTKDGFLMQAHTSGGRIPTDKGYQFFVEKTHDNVSDSRKLLRDRASKLSREFRKGNLKDFVEAFSKETKLLGIGQNESGREMYKSGLNDLFENLDVETKDEMREVINDFEMLDSRLAEIGNELCQALESPRVFIGKKSPITQSENLSVIVDSFDVNGQRILVAIVGPKRMEYERYLKLLNSFHEDSN